MGFGGISIWQLLIILLSVVLIFGGRKLRNLGSDMGGALKGFKDAMKDGEADIQQRMTEADPDPSTDTDEPTKPTSDPGSDRDG